MTENQSHIRDFCDGGYENSPEAQKKLSCLCLNLLVKLDYYAPPHLMTSEIQNGSGCVTYNNVYMTHLSSNRPK